MNNLLYNARMALRDIIEVNIFTKGSDRVYINITSLPTSDDEPATDQQREEREHAGRVHAENVVQDIIDRLRDMEMVIAGGEDGISALMESEPVEVLRRAA